MTAKSFKQLTTEGTLKRADALKVRLEDIHIKPGFNLRDPNEVDAEGKTFQQSIEELADLIADGMSVPPLEVATRDEGGVWLVDGECRTRSFWLLDEQKRLKRVPRRDNPEILEYWVSVIPFDGDEEEQEDRIFTSNKRRGLTELEMARGCKRSADRGRKPDQIAKKIGMTRQRVEQLLILAGAPPSVHQRIRAGEVSGTVAVELVRKHGDKAVEVLTAELDKAKAQGKTKVTAGTMAPKALPRTIVDDLVAQVGKFSERLTTDDRLTLEMFHRGQITGGTLTLDVETVLHLELCFDELKRIKADQEAKAREKADKAKQMELESQ